MTDDDDADDDLLLESGSKHVDTFSEIPDMSIGKSRNASTDCSGLLTTAGRERSCGPSSPVDIVRRTS
jgi:hypothetical protein